MAAQRLAQAVRGGWLGGASWGRVAAQAGDKAPMCELSVCFGAPTTVPLSRETRGGTTCNDDVLPVTMMFFLFLPQTGRNLF